MSKPLVSDYEPSWLLLKKSQFQVEKQDYKWSTRAAPRGADSVLVNRTQALRTALLLAPTLCIAHLRQALSRHGRLV